MANSEVIAVLKNDINYIKKELAEINEKLDRLSNEFITRIEFEPIKKVVYGLIGISLLTIAGAVLALVIM